MHFDSSVITGFFFIANNFFKNHQRIVNIVFIILVLIFAIYSTYTEIISKEMKNTIFLQNFQLKVKQNLVLDDVIKDGYQFCGDDLKASDFFVQIGDIAREMIEEKKEKVKVIQVVLNEKPSNPFQLNGNPENDKKVEDAIIGENKEKRFELMKLRKLNTDIILKNSKDALALSYFSKEGICHQTFLQNCLNSNNQMKGFTVNESLFYSTLKGKNNKGQTIEIPINDKGQIWIFQNLKTNGFLILREEGGEQAHDVGTGKHIKKLAYYGFFKNMSEFKKYKNGEIYKLFERFDLIKYI
jgi:hypothetical protein